MSLGLHIWVFVGVDADDGLEDREEAAIFGQGICGDGYRGGGADEEMRLWRTGREEGEDMAVEGAIIWEDILGGFVNVSIMCSEDLWSSRCGDCLEGLRLPELYYDVYVSWAGRHWLSTACVPT